MWQVDGQDEIDDIGYDLARQSQEAWAGVLDPGRIKVISNLVYDQGIVSTTAHAHPGFASPVTKWKRARRLSRARYLEMLFLS